MMSAGESVLRVRKQKASKHDTASVLLQPTAEVTVACFSAGQQRAVIQCDATDTLELKQFCSQYFKRPVKKIKYFPPDK